MSISKKIFGAVPGGMASLFTIDNGKIRVTVTDMGAVVYAIEYGGYDLILGWREAAEYVENPGFIGATVGRNANRIAGAQFTLNGKVYQLPKNEGENNLHSAPDGYHNRLWNADEPDAAGNSITFRLLSPDGDQGFPGKLTLSVTYTLDETNALHILYEGVSDADTVVNLTNHTYFNLNGQGSGSIEGHILQLFADSFTPVYPDCIPTGECADVTGTPFDFREAKSVGRDIGAENEQLAIGKGYDHNFAVNGTTGELRAVAVLRGDKSGITLSVLSDCPGVQLYTGNCLGEHIGKGGVYYENRSGVCLETQFFPNAVNQESFVSPVLPAGKEYRSETVWRFS